MEGPAKPQGDEGALLGQKGLELRHQRPPGGRVHLPLDPGDISGIGGEVRHVEDVVSLSQAAFRKPQRQGAGRVAKKF